MHGKSKHRPTFETKNYSNKGVETSNQVVRKTKIKVAWVTRINPQRAKKRKKNSPNKSYNFDMCSHSAQFLSNHTSVKSM